MHHHRGRKSLSKSKIIRNCTAFLIATVLILIGIKYFGDQYLLVEGPATVGSLEGRFGNSLLTREINGRTWSYRDRDLTNILMIGIDWDEDRAKTASWRYSGQADFLLLVTLDRQKEIIQTLQIDRDTMSDIRLYGPFGDYTGQRVMQLCLSHAYGGTPEKNCENVVWAVSNYLGNIPIDAYLVLDMDSMVIINDALGGITVTLEDDFSHLDPEMTIGKTLTLQGEQAEYYLRGRIGVGEGTNSSRMQRQRVYLEQSMATFIEKVSDDMNFVGRLYDQLSGHLRTNADRGWLINQVYAASVYKTQRILTVAGDHRISDRGFMEFWPDENALEDLIARNYYQLDE